MKININNGVTAPKGFKAAGVHCGIKKSSLKKDLAIIYSDVPATACGVYTKNKVKGAPLLITKKHLSNKCWFRKSKKNDCSLWESIKCKS